MTTAGPAATPPHDIEAEQAVLGGMMTYPDALAECTDILTARAFWRPAHQAVFGAMATLTEHGQPVDILTVKAELERRGEMRGNLDAPYLHTLMSWAPVAASAAWHAQRLLDLQAQRDLTEAAARISEIAGATDLTRTERLDRAYKALDEASGIEAKPGAVTAADLIDPLLDSLDKGPQEGPEGIPSGWADLDSLIPGFRPGQFVVIGARPSMGKSDVLVNWVTNAALRLGRTVLAVTLEMPRDEYMERVLASEAEVDLDRIRRRQLTEDDWARIQQVRPAIRAADGLAIHDGPVLSVRDIRAELRAMRRAGHPADLVTVDYLTLVEPAKQSDNRQLEVSDISRKLKLLAKEFEVPVVVAAALNRGPEMRSDHRPLLADLRDSGSIEADSDIVILLYREDAYDEESPRAGEIDLIVAKNRQGRKATVTLAFQGHYARCREMYRISSSALSAAPTAPEHPRLTALPGGAA